MKLKKLHSTALAFTLILATSSIALHADIQEAAQKYQKEADQFIDTSVHEHAQSENLSKTVVEYAHAVENLKGHMLPLLTTRNIYFNYAKTIELQTVLEEAFTAERTELLNIMDSTQPACFRLEYLKKIDPTWSREQFEQALFDIAITKAHWTSQYSILELYNVYKQNFQANDEQGIVQTHIQTSLMDVIDISYEDATNNHGDREVYAVRYAYLKAFYDYLEAIRAERAIRQNEKL